MKLAQKLLQLRRQRELSQKTVAAGCGISRQTYNGYETGLRYPRQRATYEAMAKFFDVDVNYLFGENEQFVTDASDRYGAHGMAQARALVGELAGMFAGGELTEEDKVAVMRSLEQAFWLAKEENKKYAPKRFRK
ncbi:helix-turn-helix transcriptional regulator [Selenomonas bovis]|jgi:transcriptional regulator with XRE-family HTH domain|uniref:Helix-turn-helix transcriptional regulator n=1 Tax=Selenomonas bovis TaxID=416586 RepID=A0A848BE51_9FIRM|nr:helix-turn-helix transcriptional regulator [Selenomonas bovis]NMD99301.1 helix-turn-helix transcriptional regulator [Selenomonas bovis]